MARHAAIRPEETRFMATLLKGWLRGDAEHPGIAQEAVRAIPEIIPGSGE
jgi:hypothetical protein